MNRHVLIAFVSLVLGLSSACNFSIGGFPDTDKANKLVDESNALQTEGMKLKDDAVAKYKDLLKDNPTFEEMADLADPMKEVEKQLETSKSKLGEAASKSDEASKLNIADWFKQYLAARGEHLRKESEVAGLAAQLVKISYDPAVATEEDFQAQSKQLNDKLAQLRKEQDELKAKVDKISEEHKDDFKK
ncbi:MAG TPA: hypothetical protein PLF26_18345 [Blastocatellia bacterium]|nr:hypothetical protein [Blastocatellia bacterium]